MGPGPPINISFTLKKTGVGGMVGSLQGLCWIPQEHETSWVKSQYGRQLLQMTLWAGGSGREQQGPQQYLLPADTAKKLFLLFISLKQFSVSEAHTTTSPNPKFVKMCNPGSEDHWNTSLFDFSAAGRPPERRMWLIHLKWAVKSILV